MVGALPKLRRVCWRDRKYVGTVPPSCIDIVSVHDRWAHSSGHSIIGCEMYVIRQIAANEEKYPIHEVLTGDSST